MTEARCHVVETHSRPTNWKPGDTERARAYWEDYISKHDLSLHHDQVAGIDPDTGHVWFGTSALDIWDQQKQKGTPRPLFYVRVGKEYYITKGARR